ncbi:MAG: hypothetical protein RL456_3000 [Pseudomonadota bacterium]|jgi:RNA polymerase sigma-70 factor (ECF subfamily)
MGAPRESPTPPAATDLQPPDQRPGLGELLLRLARDGRESDWEELIAGYGRYLRRVCSDIVPRETWVDDAVQETLLCLHRELPHFTYQGEAAAWTWVRMICASCARRIVDGELARARREDRVGAERAREQPAGPLGEQQELLVAALRRLTPLQCTILSRRFIAGATAEEIASELGMSTASVQKQGHRALTRLRDMLAPRERTVAAPAFALLALLSAPHGALAEVARPGAAAEGPAAAGSAGPAIPAKGILLAAAGVVLAGGIATAALWPAALPQAAAGSETSPPPPAASTAMAEDAFLRSFLARNAGCRETDWGRNLGDGSRWLLDGPWMVGADGGSAAIDLLQPGSDLRRARLALRTAVDPVQHPRLILAELAIDSEPLRCGFGLGAMPDPAAKTLWAGLTWEHGFGPRLLARGMAEHQGPDSGMTTHVIGLASEAAGSSFLLDGEVRSAARMLGEAVRLEIALYGRLLEAPRRASVRSVRVFAAPDDPLLRDKHP